MSITSGMLPLRFEPNDNEKQVPQGMRYMMIVDCQANIDVLSGGLGGHLITSCPYQGSRCVAWPEHANVVRVDFLSGNTIPTSPYAEIWFSSLPLRIDMIGEIYGDAIQSVRGSLGALPLAWNSSPIGNSPYSGQMAPFAAAAGMDREGGGVNVARPIGVAESITRGSQPENSFALKTAAYPVRARTYIARAEQSVMPYSMSWAFAGSGKNVITFLDFSNMYPNTDVYILGCKVHITENSAAVKVALDLDASAIGTTVPGSVLALNPYRVDDAPTIDTNILPYNPYRVTAVGLNMSGGHTQNIRRQLFWLGIMPGASTAEPIAEPFTVDLADFGSSSPGSPIMMRNDFENGWTYAIFSLAVEVNAATTMRLAVEWVYAFVGNQEEAWI